MLLLLNHQDARWLRITTPCHDTRLRDYYRGPPILNRGFSFRELYTWNVHVVFNKFREKSSVQYRLIRLTYECCRQVVFNNIIVVDAALVLRLKRWRWLVLLGRARRPLRQTALTVLTLSNSGGDDASSDDGGVDISAKG